MTAEHDTSTMTPMKKTKKTKTAFMCGIALQHEVGETAVLLYPSPKALKKDHSCCDDECGIAEVEVRLKRWVRKPRV